VRIDRLLLGRYGHLVDVELAFPADRGLHVVLGGNEAGKSTALAAVGDCLFGFPFRTDYAFLHKTRDLRLAVDLRARDGRAARFARLKRNSNDLLDGADMPVPESRLASFLGGASRERFDRVFGLDAAELRKGGAAILEGKGEVGESILQAHTGMSGFRALVEKLGEAASQLHGDRRRRRDLHAAADAFKTAREALDSRGVEPAAYQDQRAAEQRLIDARDANARDSAALHAERSRLERIFRTAPALRARTRDLDLRAMMGEVPSLPADAEARRQEAILLRDRAAHDLEREGAREAVLSQELAGLTVDTALLAEAEAIDALAAEQNRIIAARRDRDERRSVAAGHQREVEQAGRRLGLTDDATRLAARVPGALTRAAAKRASDAHERLSARREQAEKDREAAIQQVAAAEAAVALAPEAEPFAALRAAIDAARAEGRVDDEVRQAAADRDAAAVRLDQALAALPLWSGTAAALAQVPVPLPAALERVADALRTAEQTLLARRQKRAECDAALADIAADLRGLSVAGELPTTQAIASARERRDRAWRLIRRHLVEGGAAPDTTERAGLPALPLPDALEELVRGADALADRRAGERERVVRFEQLRERQAQQQALREAAAVDETAAAAARDAAQTQWMALWHPAGVVPLEPAAMRDWLRERDAVLALGDRAGESDRKLEAAKARHAAAWTPLAQMLPGPAEQAAGRLDTLLRSAGLICADRERAGKARADAQARLEAAVAVVEKIDRTLERLGGEQAAWRDGWAGVAAHLGLPAGASAEDGKLALELWNDIDKAAAKWREAEDRIADMGAAIDGFVTLAAALVRRVAPGLADCDPHDAVRTLAARLVEGRQVNAERARKQTERQAAQAAVDQAAAAHTAAETTLAGLRVLAGATDDAALQATIGRAREHAELSRRIAEREAELAREDRSPADLDADAAGVDLDALPGRLSEIEQRLRAIADENAAYAGKLTQVRAVLQDMERGRDAAGAAQDMRNALAEIDEISERYVRLRLAHTLLRAGIDRFRRQQQGPLLGRAGALFARLTEGRYDRLSVEEAENGQLFIVALRPDGSDCPADRLSEGTRDQLYLALRLAAIESYAARAEPLPFIADDLLVNFDDRRARAALRVLAEFGAVTQTILFTHHHHIVELADPATASLHRLPDAGVLAA
jgi:uncharacterized protein YhaN